MVFGARDGEGMSAEKPAAATAAAVELQSPAAKEMGRANRGEAAATVKGK